MTIINNEFVNKEHINNACTNKTSTNKTFSNKKSTDKTSTSQTSRNLAPLLEIRNLKKHYSSNLILNIDRLDLYSRVRQLKT